jgi:photosystem II stability/assembly factor-like uncharacterized protein
MRSRLLLIAILLCSFIVSAQFNKSAPWVKDLNEKNKSQLTAKSSNKQYSLYELSKAFDEYWKDKDQTKKGSGHKPYKRWESFWKHFVDEKGYLPTAQELWQTWENKQNSNINKNAISNWTAVGPFSHLAEGARLPGQGRVNVIAVDPNDVNTWYIGAPAGGIWKSTDAGNTWTPLTDNLPQIGVSGIAIDPNNSNIIYIATGDDDAGDSFSVGVFKSMDGGVTWNQTGLNPSNSPLSMNDIYIDPNDSNTLWVATSNGVYKTTNAGTSWSQVLVDTSLSPDNNIKDIKLKPGNSNIIYVATEDKFYKSTNGGASFIQKTSNLPASSSRYVLEVTEANPNVVYLLSSDTPANDYAFQGLYKSTDSGETFTKTAEARNILESTQAWFDLALAVSPTNENEVYIGCLNVWKSTNGGNSFNQLNSWFSKTPSYTHADIHMLRFFNGTLFCGSDGGVYSSIDGGETFRDHTEGLAISQFYRITVASKDASKIIGGLQDNGGHSYRDGQWRNYHGGDGMDNVMNQDDDALIYGFTQYGGSLNISANGGKDLVAQVSAPNGLQGEWITPLAIDSDGNIYAGFNALFRLQGSSWRKISDDFASNALDVEIDPNDISIIYVAVDNVLKKSTNFGNDFIDIHTFNTNINEIEVNNTDGNIVYVTTAALGKRGVFKSIDGGDNFENITRNLPSDQPYFTIIHQGRHSQNPIYVGTSLGVYRLDDSLTEWEAFSTGLPNTSVRDLDISLDDAIITAATYGRGIWQSPLEVETPSNEVRLVSINSPIKQQVSCGDLTPEITVENLGSNAITSITFNYGLNDTLNSFTWNGNIAPGETENITLPQVTPVTLGLASLTINASIPNDTYNDNNQLSVTIYTNKIGNGGELNDFESSEDALIAFNENDTDVLWELGEPTGPLLNQTSSGTQAYATNLNGNHPDLTKSYLVSRCYNMSTITNPVLKFSMAYNLEENWDIVYVEYSTNNGSDWNVLGSINSQPNWYTSNRTNASSGAANDCQNCPGAQWTGTNTTLTEYAYDFTTNATNGETDLRGETEITFRIVFHSDANVNQEGVVIDDFILDGEQDDEDDDNDGILDVDDNCPKVANANQTDTDGDGLGDACDDDDDNDGVPDVNDNCPLIANANQADDDNDGIGNICDDDADNDGVPDASDACPDTPEGTTVDVTGCPIFSLPTNNFATKTVSETCISSNNGAIEIEAQTSYTYTAVLTGGGVNETQQFTSATTFENLSAGDYEICITLAEEPGYEQYFNVTISEPQPLSVFSKVQDNGKSVALDLQGGQVYFIELNGELFSTTNSEIVLPLTQAKNTLRVTTDKNCQGEHFETILVSDKVLIYPNPIKDNRLIIELGNLAQDELHISMFSYTGTKVFSKNYKSPNGRLELQPNILARGAYILNIKTHNQLLSYKIIKR